MRKFNVNLHFDVVVPVEIEAINQENALDIASEMELDFNAPCLDVFDGEHCITDIDRRMSDYDDTISDLVSRCNEEDPGRFSVDELTTAAEEVVEFDDDYFENASVFELVAEILDIAERNEEDLLKTMDKCRGENF